MGFSDFCNHSVFSETSEDILRYEGVHVFSEDESFIFDQMLQSMSSDCYKVTISSITYEVLFSYDNSYYTHCYHQTVKEYKSNGSLIRSKTDYYQAIGG